ncbi:MAG: type II secretion system protein GspM [Betaproteobacteria bacterium]
MIGQQTFDRWRNRPPREQWLIGVPVLALTAMLLYVGAWEPLQASLRRLRTALPELEARRESVRAQAAELRSQPATASAPALNAALVRAAIERRQLSGATPTLDAAGENRARLAFARIPFHALWPLLQDLQTDRGIRIVSLRVDRLDSANVRVDALLGAGDR